MRFAANLLLPFRYGDKGTLATIGRSRGVAVVGKLHCSGLLAWLLWLFVHVTFLIGFRNRAIVMFEWAWAYLTFQRSARVILEHPVAVLDPSSSSVLASCAPNVQAPNAERTAGPSRDGPSSFAS